MVEKFPLRNSYQETSTLDPFRFQLNPVHILIYSVFKMHFNIILPTTLLFTVQSSRLKFCKQFSSRTSMLSVADI
jgi:hypothetical protein